MCLSAAAAVARSGQEVLFVDTTGGFKAARLAQLHALQSGTVATAEAQRRTLGGVRCAQAFDVHEALRLLDALLRGGVLDGTQDASAQARRPALVVFDSASALLSPLLTTKHAQGASVCKHSQPSCCRWTQNTAQDTRSC